MNFDNARRETEAVDKTSESIVQKISDELPCLDLLST